MSEVKTDQEEEEGQVRDGEMSSPVSVVQQLIQQAKRVFLASDRGGRFATADMEKLKMLVNSITAKDFNVDPSVADKEWNYYPHVMDAPAACMEVYECSSFSIGIFFLKPNKSMPLHDHPDMHGIMKTLFGSMTVTSYSIESPQNGEVPAPPTSPTSEFLAQCVSTIKLTTESEPCCLYPTQGNIHKIQAADEPVAFLDILGPPYSPAQGRDCNYYFIQPKETSSDGSVYLKAGSNPSWFSCIPLGSSPYSETAN